jgi:GT2 family glycosyltransferase
MMSIVRGIAATVRRAPSAVRQYLLFVLFFPRPFLYNRPQRTMASDPGNPASTAGGEAAGLTIVVLTRNRRELLRDCLESLFAQEDPGVPLEFVVVDDGSNDKTAEMVRELTAGRDNWRLVRQPHRGIAAARNAGIGAARGAWLAIVADDYLLPPGYARTVADYFRRDAQAEVVRFRVADASSGYLGRALYAYQEAGVLRRLAGAGVSSGGCAPGLEASGAAAFRCRVFRRVGLFDESFPRGEDTEFSRRLAAAGIAVHYSPELRIPHRVRTGLASALAKAFAGGRASWRLHAAGSGRATGPAALAALALRAPAAALYWSCWRAWRTGGPLRFPAYWPPMLALEAAARAGFLSAAMGRGGVPGTAERP